MPLDRHAKRFLDLFAAGGGARAQRPSPTERRQAFQNLARASTGDGNPAIVRREIVIPGPGGVLPLRLYRPGPAPSGLAPGFVFFHGGGWVTGDLDTHDGICAALAEASHCPILAVGYRLAPEHPFPAAIEDGIAAIAWAAAHAQECGIDARRLGVAGDSAGATIAAAACQWAKREAGPKLVLQALFCPVLDARGQTPSHRLFGSGYFLDQATMEDDLLLHSGPGAARDDPRRSPVCAGDFSGLPPAHIHTAEFDPVRDDGRAYAEKLAAAGVDVAYECHAGMIHYFYGMQSFIPFAAPFLRQAGEAMARALGPAV